MIYLFLQSVIPTVPAGWLTFADGVVYKPYGEQPVRVWGISATDDQQLAGAIMKIGGSMFLWTIVIFLWFRRFSRSYATENDYHRTAPPAPDAADVTALPTPSAPLDAADVARRRRRRGRRRRARADLRRRRARLLPHPGTPRPPRIRVSTERAHRHGLSGRLVNQVVGSGSDAGWAVATGSRLRAVDLGAHAPKHVSGRVQPRIRGCTRPDGEMGSAICGISPVIGTAGSVGGL